MLYCWESSSNLGSIYEQSSCEVKSNFILLVGFTFFCCFKATGFFV
jgi:hypothetical protein